MTQLNSPTSGLRRRLAWCAVPLLAIGACTGLHLDNGNNWPCDYSLPPGARDAPCMAGDVCGLDNVCRRYVYEGPRFEDVATVPTFGPGSAHGQKLHPLALDSAVTTVVAELPLDAKSSLWVRNGGDNFFEITPLGLVNESLVSLPPLPPQLGVVTRVQSWQVPGEVTRRVAALTSTNNLIVARLGAPMLPVVVQALDGGNLVTRELRFVELASGRPARDVVPVTWNQQLIGTVAGGTVERITGANPAATLDVAALGDSLVVLEADTLALHSGRDAGFADRSTLALEPFAVTAAELHSDRDGRIITALRHGDEGSVLSTWQVTSGATGPTLTEAWPACRPCPGRGVVALSSASVSTGRPVVEVLCRAAGTNPPSALRVTGSVALSQNEACLTESLALPVPVPRLLAASRWSHQFGLVLGGSRGELWVGATLSTLTPLYLDRAPLDVSTLQTPSLDGGAPRSTLMAVTDRYLSVQQSVDLLPDAGARLNGFRRVNPRELGVADDARLLGFVHGIGNWGVTSTGDVVKTEASLVRSGPRLTTSSGGAITSSIGGEAVSLRDGGLQAFFLAADDALYFLDRPRRFLDAGALPELETELAPQLIPEPSVPIRSVAVERTPLGTSLGEDNRPGDVDHARGYLVTSRNVYGWQLADGRWSSAPVVVAGSEPLEVWFDSKLSALGRVGYRDGEIYSLPGGTLLAEALPADAGVPPQVLDFENLGGWPAAYATTGLFVAGWDLVGGKLANRFADGGINRPMSWRRVTLPDGGEPWLQGLRRPGKLFVVTDPEVDAGAGDPTLKPHRLLLFLDDQVLQVAEHVRK